MQLFIRSNVSINKLSVHYCFQKFWIKKNCEIKSYTDAMIYRIMNTNLYIYPKSK